MNCDGVLLKTYMFKAIIIKKDTVLRRFCMLNPEGRRHFPRNAPHEKIIDRMRTFSPAGRYCLEKLTEGFVTLVQFIIWHRMFTEQIMQIFIPLFISKTVHNAKRF